MDEIIPGLWIGDLQSAKNMENLKAHGIFSILTAMRGRITIHEVLLFCCWKTRSILISNKQTFIRHQIQLDDTEDADVMTHFLPSIHFIQAELDKGRGVLVHCHAGVSTSFMRQYCQVFLFPKFHQVEVLPSLLPTSCTSRTLTLGPPSSLSDKHVPLWSMFLI